jgi:hypothetical protein
MGVKCSLNGSEMFPDSGHTLLLEDDIYLSLVGGLGVKSSLNGSKMFPLWE